MYCDQTGYPIEELPVPELGCDCCGISIDEPIVAKDGTRYCNACENWEVHRIGTCRCGANVFDAKTKEPDGCPSCCGNVTWRGKFYRHCRGCDACR